MRTLSRLAVAGLLLGLAGSASAQEVDEVIERHLTAMGGRDVIANLESRSIAGTVTLSTPQGDLTGAIEVLNRAPNKERTLITLDLSAFGAGQMTFDQRFDGTSGYVVDTLQGNRDITGDQLASMRNNSFPTPYLTYRERGTSVRLDGKQKAGDREAYVLVLEPKSGPAVRQYIDAETYLLLRLVSTAEAPQIGPLEQTTDLSDYRDVDGVKVPFAVKISSPVQTISVTITRVEHNVAIDDSLFSKPAN